MSFRAVADRHGHEPDVFQMARLLASWSDENVAALEPLIARYHEAKGQEPVDLHQALTHSPRSGGLEIVRDLHDLWLLTQEIKLFYELLNRTAHALRDGEMESILRRASGRTGRQADWLRTRIDHAAPQALTVPS